MNYQDCLDWILNGQHRPDSYVHSVGSLVISIPYLLLMYYLYRTKIVQRSKKTKYFFFLTLPIVAAIYFSILYSSFVESKDEILSFIGFLSYMPVMFSIWFSYLSIIPMIILAVVKFKEE